MTRGSFKVKVIQQTPLWAAEDVRSDGSCRESMIAAAIRSLVEAIGSFAIRMTKISDTRKRRFFNNPIHLASTLSFAFSTFLHPEMTL